MQGSCKITIAKKINATELLLFVFVIIGLSSNNRRQRFPCIWYLQQTLYSVFTTLQQRLLVFPIPCLQGGSSTALPVQS